MKTNAGTLYAIAAAVLFGASTPAIKPLLGNASPVAVAALLYLGSGIGLAVLWLFRNKARAEAPLRGRDWYWLAGSTLFGGVVAPILFTTGLAVTNAASASLLMNLEAVATAAIAWIVAREHASAQTIVGTLAVVAGAILLGWSPSPHAPELIGALLIAGACVAWAIDNNLTRNISGSDAVAIAGSKSLVAGIVNAAIATLAMHATFPTARESAIAMIIGLIGYGASLVCYVRGLRDLGTARTGAYFSAAPFVGAVVSFAMGSAAGGWRFAASAALMLAGVTLHLTERHEHEHEHEALEHDHLHVHDEHHRHEHGESDPRGEPHAHAHRHARLVHAHGHFPDIHHRHDHS